MPAAVAAIASEAAAFQVCVDCIRVQCYLVLIILKKNRVFKFIGMLFCLGAKLPLYAFKKKNKVDTEKAFFGSEKKKEPPVEFLDSLLLGEVKINLTDSLI